MRISTFFAALCLTAAPFVAQAASIPAAGPALLSYTDVTVSYSGAMDDFSLSAGVPASAPGGAALTAIEGLGSLRDPGFPVSLLVSAGGDDYLIGDLSAFATTSPGTLSMLFTTTADASGLFGERFVATLDFGRDVGALADADFTVDGAARLEIAAPVPLPAAAPLLIGGMALLAGMRLRRRR